MALDGSRPRQAERIGSSAGAGAVVSGRLRPGLPSLEHQLLADAQAAHQLMAAVLPLRQVRPLVAGRDFYQEIGLLHINQVPLLSYASAAAQISTGHTPAVQLVACFAGGRVARTGRGVVTSRAGSGVLLPPGACKVSGSDSCAVMTLRPEDLARTAAAISGDGAAEVFHRFAPRELGGVEARQLHALMQHLDACVASDPALPAQLGLDDLLLRLVVSWLQPLLLLGRPADHQRIGERCGRSSFDELIDYIRANLHQPLRLSELERRSHYSRRALQYAFRKKLGCTPHQWIREQRLERAMQQLRQGGRGSSIQAIALGCGYRHGGHFSADFKKRFGLTPSAARRGRGGDSTGVWTGCGTCAVLSPPCSAECPAERAPLRQGRVAAEQLDGTPVLRSRRAETGCDRRHSHPPGRPGRSDGRCPSR
ncbi:MAG: helix-turn-helix transcriptional regulator [Cyanobium sp. M30B3]|nr:MAG: helix-turn-helix transcriptional regulator [Cyanobium sp. M30B3]